MPQVTGIHRVPEVPTAFELKPGHGRAVWWSNGSVITVYATHEETNGPFAVADQLCPPGYTTPLHVHHEHDEALLALTDGFDVYYEATNGDLTIRRPNVGEGLYLQQGLPHGFHNTSAEPRRMGILFESPLEMGFLEAGIPIVPPVEDLPRAPDEVLEADRVGDLADAYATDAIAPLPINE